MTAIDWTKPPFNHAVNCPRWDSCSAPICPLEPDWRKHEMRLNEKLCHHLREYAKHPTRAILGGVLTARMVDLVVECYEEAIKSSGPLKRGLLRTANKNSITTRYSGIHQEENHGNV
jgi:hypothetical protein